MHRLPRSPQSRNVEGVGRRTFLKISGMAAGGWILFGRITSRPQGSCFASIDKIQKEGYDWTQYSYGFVVDTEKCIGCGSCAKACKRENKVPDGFYRTWVERYIIPREGECVVESPQGGLEGFESISDREDISKAFFVPKLCNHCAKPPCVQVCPVGATFLTKDGVVLIDEKQCVGCCYCVQACPYGARYFHPDYHCADKCTWCYHRITRGLEPACVEVCPVGARVFGNLRDPDSEVSRILELRRINVLKADLGTRPKIFYVGLDEEVT